MNDEDLRTVETYRLELYMQACENLSAENEAVRLSGAQTLVGLGDFGIVIKLFLRKLAENMCRRSSTLYAPIYDHLSILPQKLKTTLKKLKAGLHDRTYSMRSIFSPLMRKLNI